MNPLLRYAEILEDVEALQALGYIAPIRCFEDAEALFDGPDSDDDYSDPPDEEQEICPDCGGPADECEHSCPPTDEDRKAREDLEEPS